MEICFPFCLCDLISQNFIIFLTAANPMPFTELIIPKNLPQNKLKCEKSLIAVQPRGTKKS